MLLLALTVPLALLGASVAVDLSDPACRTALPSFEKISHAAGVEEGDGPDGKWSFRFRVTRSWNGSLPKWPSADLRTSVTDWRPYDRLVIDVFNESIGGDVLGGFLAGPSGRVQNGLPLPALALEDHGFVRWEIRLSGWPETVDPGNVGRIHLFMQTPNAANLVIGGFHLLRPGEPVPTLAAGFLDRQVQPHRRREAELHKRQRRECIERFVGRCRAAGQTGGVCWVGQASSMTKVRPREAFDVEAAKEFELCLARNEREALQVLVLPVEADLEQVRVEVTEMTSIPASAFSVSPVGYVKTRRPAPYLSGSNVATNLPGGYWRTAAPSRRGWWPDPILSYLDAVPVARGDLQSFWVSVTCPGDQPAGTYRGQLRVSGPGWRKSFPLSVRVWDFSVPRESPLPLAVSFAPGPSEQFADADQLELVRTLKADQSSPVNLWRRREAEWGRFLADRYLTMTDLYHDGGAVSWPVLDRLKKEGRLGLFNLGYWSVPRNMSEDVCAAWLADVRARLAGTYRQARERGLLGQAILYGCDEANEGTFERVRWAAGQLKREFPGVPLMTTAYDRNFGVGSDLSGIDWFAPTVDVFAETPTAIEASRQAGHRVWWYVACDQQAPLANVFVEGQAIEPRILMGALTALCRPDGFLYYQTSIWNSRRCIGGRTAFTDWDPCSWTRFHGDGSLFCCGPDGIPLATVRSENFRDGLEDYAYVKELERLTGVRCEIPSEVCRSVSQYTDDPTALLAWRRDIASRIERKGKDK